MTRTIIIIIILAAAARAWGQERVIEDAEERREIIEALRERYYDQRIGIGEGAEATVRAVRLDRSRRSEGMRGALEEGSDSTITTMNFRLVLAPDRKPVLFPVDPAQTQGLFGTNAFNAVRDMTTNAWKFLLYFMDDMFVPVSDSACRIVEKGDGYEISFSRKRGEVWLALTKDLTITRFGSPGSIESGSISFIPSEEGLLVKDLSMLIEKVDLRVHYEYQVIGGHHLPTQIRMSMYTPKGESAATIRISDYRFNDK